MFFNGQSELEFCSYQLIFFLYERRSLEFYYRNCGMAIERNRLGKCQVQSVKFVYAVNSNKKIYDVFMSK